MIVQLIANILQKLVQALEEFMQVAVVLEILLVKYRIIFGFS